MLDKIRGKLLPYAPIFLRLGIGVVFMLFAVQKLGSPEQGRAEIQILLNLKIGGAAALNYILGVMEIIIAISLFSGAFIRWTGLGAAMLVMLFLGGLVTKYGFSQDPTLNRDLGLIGGLISLWVQGAGPLSLDAWFEKKKKKAQINQ